MSVFLYGKVENNKIIDMQTFEEEAVPEGYVKIEYTGNTLKKGGSKTEFVIVANENNVFKYDINIVPGTPSEYLKARTDEGFNFNGKVFQIDRDSRVNITGKALRLQLDNTEPMTQWRTMDNQMVSFTKAEFIEFAKAVSDYYEQCFMDSLTAV